MTPQIQIDTREFQRAAKEYAAQSKRELADELNKRMFYILLRLFVILPPRSISAAKAKAKAYLEAIKPRLLAVGQRARTKSKLLRRVDLIAQASRRKAGLRPLTPAEIEAGKAKKGVSTLRRRASAQGYVKSSVVRALNALSRFNLGRSFSQFGRVAKVSRRTGQVTKPEQPPNAALVKIASEYGVSAQLGSSGNVGLYGGTKAGVIPARPGVNPTVNVSMEGIIASGETGKVNSELAAAAQRAINDETRQMTAKLAERMQAVANRYSA